MFKGNYRFGTFLSVNRKTHVSTEKTNGPNESLNPHVK